MARIPFDSPVRVLLPNDPSWPPGVGDLAEPPEQLHIVGQLPELSRAVAIVGTRFADPDATNFARRLGRDLAIAGWVVVSGGAAGVDAAAHEGALEAGGLTVAVLATGLARAYPPENARLFAQIAQCGAVVSEFVDGRARGRGWAFLKRNRLVAALSQRTVIVQAPYRSGALSTARWAKILKRRVFTVPAAPWDSRGTGCLQLLADGAEICTSAADVLSLTPSDGGQARLRFGDSDKHLNDDAGLPASARALWRWLRARPGHPDEISAALDMPLAEVQEALLTLVLIGRCTQRVDGTYEVRAV